MMFISLGIGTVAALALIVVVSILTGGSTKSNNLATSALVGTTVKDFTLSGLNGGSERAPWTSGHAAVLIFFASWCGPCQSEMPKVATYLRAHPTGSIVVMGVDANDARGSAQAFVRKDGVAFPIASDPNGAVTTGIFQFATVPETVFVNARGVVTDVYFGAIPPSRLKTGIAALRAAA
jgi:peroxiredoxin